MWGCWFWLLANIILSRLYLGHLKNGQIGASEKTDNDILLAQTKGSFILETDDLFPVTKAKPVLKKKGPV
jgi:hypothetical protein